MVNFIKKAPSGLLLLLAVLFINNMYSLSKSKDAVFKEVLPASYQDYIYGAIIGAALGDALGRPVEFLSTYEQIKKHYPKELSDFSDFKATDFWMLDGKSQAAFTDDTQMASIVLDVFTQNLEDINKYGFANHFVSQVMSRLASRFVGWSHDVDGGLCVARAPGNTCLRGCVQLEKMLAIIEDQRLSNWWENGGGEPGQIDVEGGSGSVMRAWPIGLALAWPPGQTDLIEKFAVSQSKMTHRHPKALAASAAIAVGVYEALALNKPAPEKVVLAMIESAKKYDHDTADLMTWAFMQAKSGQAEDLKILDRLQSWAADEAIAAAIYVFMKCHNNLAQALKMGVNTTGDSDTIATLSGALVGAYSGISNLREFKQIEKLEKINELKKQAQDIYQKHQARINRFIVLPDEMVLGCKYVA